jgi:hypothetical protein
MRKEKTEKGIVAKSLETRLPLESVRDSRDEYIPKLDRLEDVELCKV